MSDMLFEFLEIWEIFMAYVAIFKAIFYFTHFQVWVVISLYKKIFWGSAQGRVSTICLNYTWIYYTKARETQLAEFVIEQKWKIRQNNKKMTIVNSTSFVFLILPLMLFKYKKVIY